MKINKTVFKITLSAIFLSIAYVLPFLTAQIPEIGSMLCPMHIPVILCGFICGWKYGLAIGIIAPLLRGVTLGMPPLFPTALAMCVELGTYGLVSGLMYKLMPKKIVNIFFVLVVAMLVGRLIWGITMFTLMGFELAKFNLSNFWSLAFVNALPGIAIQIVLIPIIVITYNKVSKYN